MPAHQVAGRRRGAHYADGVREFGADDMLRLVLVFGPAAVGVCVAYAMARGSSGEAHFYVFWLAFLYGALGALTTGLQPTMSSDARAVLLGAYGVFTFLPKFLMSVNHAVYFDEYGHLRHANDIISQHSPMPSNSLIPIIKYFPGLGVLTAVVHYVTQLSTWHSGQLVVLAAHTGSLFAVYGIARCLGASDRRSFLAAMIFSLNPSFLYFDTQYAYESVGLPLALATVWLALRVRAAQSTRDVVHRALIAVAVALCTVLTHHISALMMTVLLLLVALCAAQPTAVPDLVRPIRQALWVVFGSALTFTVVWLGIVARGTQSYIGPHVSSATDQVLQRLGIESTPSVGTSSGAVAVSNAHVPFSSSGAPLFERVAGFVSPIIALMIAVLAVSILWSRRRDRAWVLPVVPMVLVALTYFLSLPLALTADGSELAHRSWPFGYLGIAVLAAVALPASVPDRLAVWLTTWRLPAAAIAAFVIVAIGNVAAGESVAYRFPGPYAFGSDTLSSTSEGVSLARWANDHLPSGAVVVTDRFTAELITGYSDLQVPDPSQGAVYGIYENPDSPPTVVRAALGAGGFGYFVLDRRILTMQPRQSLFAGYGGRGSIDVLALSNIKNNSFITLVHTTTNYAVYRISP